MIKDENVVIKFENSFLNRKRERSVESPNKYYENSNNLTIKNTFNLKEKYLNSDNSKAIKYEKYAKLIENFFVNKYGMKVLQESCFICHSNNFLAKELLNFDNSINLFYIYFI